MGSIIYRAGEKRGMNKDNERKRKRKGNRGENKNVTTAVQSGVHEPGAGPPGILCVRTGGKECSLGISKSNHTVRNDSRV